MMQGRARYSVPLRLALLVAVAALALGLAACGVEQDPTPTTAPAIEQPTSPPAVADTPASVGDTTPVAPSPTPGDGETGAPVLDVGAQVTPPALLPDLVGATPPALEETGTQAEGTSTPPDTPAPAPPTAVPPADTPAPPAPPTGNRVGDSAPDFEVTTTDGVTRSLTDYKQANQPVLLYFFATW